MGLELWQFFLGAIAVIAVVSAGITVGRNKAKDELIDTQDRQIEALRHELEDSDRRCTAKIDDLQTQVTHLLGKVDLLSEQQGAAIGAAIAPIVAKSVVAALHEHP